METTPTVCALFKVLKIALILNILDTMLNRDIVFDMDGFRRENSA